jgi:hypothetical protein
MNSIFVQLLQSENCHTHGMPLALWCHTCCNAMCRACASQTDHPGHQIKSQVEAKEQLVSEVCYVSCSREDLLKRKN